MRALGRGAGGGKITYGKYYDDVLSIILETKRRCEESSPNNIKKRGFLLEWLRIVLWTKYRRDLHLTWHTKTPGWQRNWYENATLWLLEGITRDTEGFTFWWDGPEGRQLIMPPNERPAEPLFCLDLRRLGADVCANSYVDSTCFEIFRCPHRARIMFSM